MKKSSKKGFTLAELLIVIAIIAVLIAIMFPVFGAQIDKAKAAAELANVRAKYAELLADSMLGGGDMTATADSASVSYAELKKAVQNIDKTKVYVEALAEQPTAVDTTWAEPMDKVVSSDETKKIYIIVVYDGTYMGSFAIDEDVTIDK